MPTVLRQGPYRFYFFSHEPNEPPHVHVDRDEASAKFWLDLVALARNTGFSAKELRLSPSELPHGISRDSSNAWLMKSCQN